MTGLVRAVRLQVLKQNLQLVIQLRASMLERQAALDEILGRPKGWVQQLRELRLGPLRDLEDAVADLPPEVDLTAVEEARRSAADVVTRLEGELAKGLRDAVEVGERYFRLPESRDAGYKDVFTFLDLAAELEKNLTEDTLALDSRRCDELFAEYVDLLRGIALRDSGLRVHGRELVEVFRIADALPALWGRAEGWGWRSVTVPSASERGFSGASSALGVGFPEWTVWALPLVQTELGHAFLTRARAVGPTTPPDDVLRSADAVATLVTGPAYALAALLLRLRPEDAVAPDALAGRRAATILAALREAAGKDLSLGVEGLADALAEEWLGAVVEAGGDAAEVRARPSEPGTVDLVARVRSAMERATEVVGAPEPTLLDWAADWGRVLQWAAAMRGVAEQVPPPTGTDLDLDLGVAALPRPDGRPLALPKLLSAAWLCRTGLDGAGPLTAASVDTLAEVVMRQCLLALPGPDGASVRPAPNRISSR